MLRPLLLDQGHSAMGDEIPEETRGRWVSLDVYEVVCDEAIS